MGRTDLLDSRVTNLTKKCLKEENTPSICDKDGKKLTEIPDEFARWKEYVEELYDKENKPTDEDMNIVKPEDTESIGPDIIYNEFEKALCELKNGKSEGMDNIPAELTII